GSYRVIREVHRGKIGVLYRVQDEHGHPWALKVLHSFLIQNRISLEHELGGIVERLRGVASPYLISPALAEYDGEEETFYVLYPWVERAIPLDAVLSQEGGRLPLDRVIGYVWRTLLVLRAIAPRLGMHGGLKLTNMILDGQGRFYLTDPGLAAAIYRTQPGVAPWDAIGSSDFIAPEIIEGREGGFPADLYALAAIAYRLLEGRPPFSYDDPARQRRAHIQESPPPLTRAGVPDSLQRWLVHGLAKDPRERFSSPDTALEELANILWERGWAIDFWLMMARELMALGDLNLALEHIDRVLRTRPEHPEACILKSEIEAQLLPSQVAQALQEAADFLQRGRTEAARERIQWVLERDPHNAEARRLEAQLRTLPSRPPILVLRSRNGRIFSLDREGVLGRRGQKTPPPDVDVTDEDVGRYVSRRHARLW
ncbi:MAG: serine/threonine protein kinase, partial [Thermoflexus sp.]